MAAKRWLGLVGGLAALAVAAGGGYWAYRSGEMQAQARAYSELMGLTPLDKRAAPGFSLTDQYGRSVRLAALRGKVVVLEFMDPRCTDICPIVSQEFILADRQLRDVRSQIAFVAINVNQYAESRADIMRFSREQGLNRLPNWYFLTGGTAALQHAWKSYGIYVQPNKTGDVVHSSVIYFIGKNGTEQYLANPDNNKSTIRQWGGAIAFVARQLV